MDSLKWDFLYCGMTWNVLNLLNFFIIDRHEIFNYILILKPLAITNRMRICKNLIRFKIFYLLLLFYLLLELFDICVNWL